MGSAEIGVAQTGVLSAKVEVEETIEKDLGIGEDVRGGLSAAGEYADAGAIVESAEAAELDEDTISAVGMDPEARPATEGCVEEVV